MDGGGEGQRVGGSLEPTDGREAAGGRMAEESSTKSRRSLGDGDGDNSSEEIGRSSAGLAMPFPTCRGEGAARSPPWRLEEEDEAGGGGGRM